MPRPLTKPPLYRLTLEPDAMAAFAAWKEARVQLHRLFAAIRPDGKYNVAVTFNLLDQLQTAALPKENLSDTILRVLNREPRATSPSPKETRP